MILSIPQRGNGAKKDSNHGFPFSPEVNPAFQAIRHRLAGRAKPSPLSRLQRRGSAERVGYDGVNNEHVYEVFRGRGFRATTAGPYLKTGS